MMARRLAERIAARLAERQMSRLRKGTVASVLAVATVGGFEGYRASAYEDAIGVATICYGETRNVHLGERKSKAECDAMLLKRLDEFANHVERCVKRPLSDKTEVAFVSLAYNIGEGAFC